MSNLFPGKTDAAGQGISFFFFFLFVCVFSKPMQALPSRWYCFLYMQSPKSY